MGGHGGLNILPQKKWNVYNWDNRLKVEEDIKKAEEKEERRQMVEARTKLNENYKLLKRGKGESEKEIEDKRVHKEKEINLFEKEEKDVNNEKFEPNDETFSSVLKKRLIPWYKTLPRDRMETLAKVDLKDRKSKEDFYEVYDPEKNRKLKKYRKKKFLLEPLFDDIESGDKKKLKKLKKEMKKLKKKLKKEKKKRKKEKKKKEIEEKTSSSEEEDEIKKENEYQKIVQMRKERMEREQREMMREMEIMYD